MIGAELLITLTSLRYKICVRSNWRAGKRFSHRTVTRGYRNAVYIALGIAGEAEAVGDLVCEIEVLGANLRRRRGLRPRRDPVVDLLRNVLFVRIQRPDLTWPWRLTRALHVAPGYVGECLTGKDRTGALDLREGCGAATGDVDSDVLAGRLAGGGSAESEISAAELVIVTSPGLAGSHHRRCKCEKQALRPDSAFKMVLPLTTRPMADSRTANSRNVLIAFSSP
jgi:hypothetical protein